MVRILVALLAVTSLSHAAPRPRPLKSLPADKLIALAPLLRTTDVVLVETDDKGALKQLTTIAYAAAPPSVVREVVIHPERYPEFVRNTKVNTVQREPGGTFLHHYAISYTLYTFDGWHRYVLLPPDGPGAPPVDMYDPEDNCEHHFRMEFLPAAGGGTVVVLYGFTVVPHDGLVGRFLKAAPTLEHGMALIPQMTTLLAMTTRAEQLTAHKPAAPTGTAGSYDFLLDRGTVALLRRIKGRLFDMSLVTRSSARSDLLSQAIGDPTAWSQWMPTLTRSTPLGQKSGVAGVELEQSLPLISFTTSFACRSDGKSADLLAIGGDLRSGRLRWDLTPRASDTEIVLRAILHYDEASLVIRELYKLEPFFELGINVGLGLLFLDGVAHHAAQLTHSHATR
jgi:hypothetical protein